MRSRALLTVVVGTFVAFGLTACSDDSTGPTSNMTQQEAQEVAQAVTQQLGFLGFAGAGASVQPDLQVGNETAEQTGDVDFDFQQSCPGGGNVAFSGTFSTSGDGTSTSLDADIEYNDCTQTPEQRTITLNTNPVFDLTSTFQLVSDNEFQMDSDLTGDFDWNIDGKSGSCGLNLSTDVTVTVSQDQSSATVTATTTGQICNQQIDESFTTTVSTS